jgi:PAS domain S-box-containing protein
VTSKLPYKFLMLLLVFALLLLVPYWLVTYHNFTMMVKDMEAVAPLTAAQRAVHEGRLNELIDDLISLGFYVFVVAFVLSLFSSRKFLLPLLKLHSAAQSIKAGDLDVRLDVRPGDEMAEVLKSFNEMAEALKENKEELVRKDTYLSAMRDPIWVANQDNVVIDTNAAFCDLFGYEREEVVGSPIFDFLDEDSDRVMRHQLRERAQGDVFTCEVSFISRKEGLIPVLISASPVVEDGEVVARLGIIKDFRAERSLMDALREERDFSEAIMQNMSDSLVVIGRDFRIVKANMAAVAHSGRDIVGDNCYRVYHNREEPCHLHGEVCPAMKVFETGGSFKAVHTHTGAGTSVYHEITSYPLGDIDEDAMYAVEILRDVTESRKLDEEISQKNRELTVLNGISRILSQSLRAEEIFDGIFEKITELTGTDGGGIYLLDDLGRSLQCRYHKGLSEEFGQAAGSIKLGDDIPGRVALTGQSAMIRDLSEPGLGEGSLLRQSGIRALACTPISGTEKTVGVFFLFGYEPRDFEPGEERLLHSISEMTGLALENIRLYETMRELYEQQRLRREKEQQGLLGLASMLSATLDIRSVLEGSLSLVKELVGADFVWLLEDDEAGGLRAKADSEGGMSEGSVVYEGGLPTVERAAMESREPVVHSASMAAGRYHFDEGLKMYNTACSVPLYVGEKALGALTLYYRSLREMREEDVHFLLTVSSILAVALERARLYENVIMERGMAATILDAMADGVLTVDMSDTVISMNRAAEEAMGITPKSALHMKRKEVLAYSAENGDLQEKMEECFDYAARGAMATREADLMDTQGRRIPLILWSAPLRDNRGGIAGVVYVLRDMSREKQLDTLKTEFVKAVSHEFRTPLASIVGMAEMVIEEDVRGEKAREYLNAILSEGSRLSALVSDVLDVARIESGKDVYTESKIDFSSLLRSVEESFEQVIEKKRVDLAVDVDREIEDFRGDEDKLKQLFRNLLDNSLTYSDSGKRVFIGVHKSGEKVKIVVEDEGWGIPKEDLGHAGEKFYRGVHAVNTTGTGLGLTISKEIVKMHGGAMYIESRPGAGTSVTVELPFRRSV